MAIFKKNRKQILKLYETTKDLTQLKQSWQDKQSWSIICFHFIIYFCPHRAACGVSAPWPGIKPMPSEVEAWSRNHWTNRELPHSPNFQLSWVCYMAIFMLRYISFISNWFRVFIMNRYWILPKASNTPIKIQMQKFSTKV